MPDSGAIYVGRKYGMLTCLERQVTAASQVAKGQNRRRRVHFLFKCDCGKEVIHSQNDIRRCRVRDCGCTLKQRNTYDLADRPLHLKWLDSQRFGRLTVLGYAGGARWLCKCVCGNNTTVAGHALKSGKILSCGCLRRETTRERGHNNTTHGEATDRTPMYQVWSGMFKRRPRVPVYEPWHDYLTFKAYMGERPLVHKLVRINRSLGFLPGNVAWRLDRGQVWRLPLSPQQAVKLQVKAKASYTPPLKDKTKEVKPAPVATDKQAA
jgi:hypothetical protein